MKNKVDAKRVIIVGAVAGGASCADRLRRLDESSEILMLDRGPYVSFANCGLPYYIGGVIAEESSLLVASEDLFRRRFNIMVRTSHEVRAIDRGRREIEIGDLITGEIYRERYDALVLSPGATPVKPPLPGVNLAGIFTLRSIPDSSDIRSWIDTRKPRSAVVVGGGFIGLEMAENLVCRGIEVTIVEMLDQVMPPIDPEMAAVVQEHLAHHGIKLVLGDGVAGFASSETHGLMVETQKGKRHQADLVILAMGVRPETALARAAGLEIGERGGIRVDAQMRTSDPNVWAVGDAVEVKDAITGSWTLVPLAGPASRQGRIAADAIFGLSSQFRGVQGTAICSVFELSVASTGASEKSLMQSAISDYEKVYLHPYHHASYYPAAERINLKLLFRKSDGRILGAQAVGKKGVDKRIDVIAMAIQKQWTVYDLEEAELCYAPQFGSAKDPVNFAGMIASDVLRGEMPIVHWNEPASANTLLLDVRDPDEYAETHAVGAISIPLAALRERLDEIPSHADIRVYCTVGMRGYVATRLLRQHGLGARNLSGGLITERFLRRGAVESGSCDNLVSMQQRWSPASRFDSPPNLTNSQKS